MHFSSHSHIPFYQNYTDMLWKTMLLVLVFKPRSSHYQCPPPPPRPNTYLWQLPLLQHVFIHLLLEHILCPMPFLVTGEINNWNNSLQEGVDDSRADMLSHLSLVWLSVTLWTIAHQATLSKGFSRQLYWSGLPCPPPGDLPNPGIKPMSLRSPALADWVL